MIRVDVDCGTVCLFGVCTMDAGEGHCDDCVDIADYINDDVYWEGQE